MAAEVSKDFEDIVGGKAELVENGYLEGQAGQLVEQIERLQEETDILKRGEALSGMMKDLIGRARRASDQLESTIKQVEAAADDIATTPGDEAGAYSEVVQSIFRGADEKQRALLDERLRQSGFGEMPKDGAKPGQSAKPKSKKMRIRL